MGRFCCNICFNLQVLDKITRKGMFPSQKLFHNEVNAGIISWKAIFTHCQRSISVKFSLIVNERGYFPMQVCNVPPLLMPQFCN